MSLINSFRTKSIEEVKHFLTQYCVERKVEGYLMQQDPMQAFYQTLCVGMEEWDDVLSYPDEFIPEEDFDTDDFIPPESEKADEMEQQPADEASGNRKGKRPRLPLAEQVSFWSLHNSPLTLYMLI